MRTSGFKALTGNTRRNLRFISSVTAMALRQLFNPARSILTFVRRHPRLIVAGSIAALLAHESTNAATQFVWQGAGVNATWSTSGNWDPATPGSTSSTTNTDIAVFVTLNSSWGNSAANPIVIDAGRDIGGIIFDAGVGNYFIGSTSGNALNLTSGGSIQMLSTLSTLTALNAVETINAPLVLQGANATNTFANNSANDGGEGDGILNFGGSITGGTAGNTTLTLTGANTDANTISGVIGNGSATSVSLTKTGSGTWVLTGANTYTGATTIDGGALVLNFGAVSSNILPSGSPLTMMEGALQLTGTGTQTVNGLTTAGNTGSQILLGANETLALGALISAGSGSALNFNTVAGGANGATVGTSIITLTGQSVGAVINSGFTVTDAGGFGLATVNASNQIVRQTTNIALLPASGGVGSGNYRVDNNSGGSAAAGSSLLTITAAESANSITVDTTTASGVVTLKPGVILSNNTWNFGGTGSNTWEITGGAIRAAASGNTITFNNLNSGAVSINASIQANGTNSVYVFGTGTLMLNGTNAYTGITEIDGGTVSVTDMGTGGSASGIGASSAAAANLVFGGGTLHLIEGGFPVTNRLFTIGDANGMTATIDSSGELDFIGRGAIAFGGTGARTLTLIGSGVAAGATNNFGLILGDGPGGATALIVKGVSTWVLGGLNTYSGVTEIDGGILNAQILGNGGNASGIGASSSSPANLVFGGGTLQYSGSAAVTSDRLFTIGDANGLTATIDSRSPISFTNSNGAIGTGGTGARTLTFTGIYTGTNTFDPGLFDGIGGATSVTMSGAGTWVLTGSNTYTGATTVSTGILKAGTATVAGASLSGAFGNNSDVVIANVTGAILDITGFNTQIGSLTGGGATGGAVTLGSATLTVGGKTSPAAYAGVISGSGGIVKTGAGTLTLSGPNTYTGATVVNGGILDLLNPNTIASTSSITVSGGATLALGVGASGSFYTSANVDSLFAGALTGVANPTGTNVGIDTTAGNFTYASNVPSVARGLVKLGANTLTLSTKNQYTGITEIDGGILNAPVLANGGSASSIGPSSAAAANLVFGGGTLQYTGTTAANLNRLFTIGDWVGVTATLDSSAASASNTLSFTSGSAIAFGGPLGGAYALTLTGANTGTNLFLPTLSDVPGGTTSLNKTGAGTWVLGVTNTYTGVTEIDGGILQANLANAGAASGLGAGSATAAGLVFGGGTLETSGTSNRLFTIGDANGLTATLNLSAGALGFTSTGAIVFGGVGARTLTLTGASVTATFAPLLGDGSGGATALTKTGTGTWLLSGANTYTGATEIDAGILNTGTLANVNTVSSIGRGSAAGSAADLVFGGGTLQYKGTAPASTNRLFTVGDANGLGAIIDSSAAAATNTLSFTGAGAIALGGTGARMLTLTGTNTGTNIFAPILRNGTGGSTAFTKTGAGLWILSGANTYTGVTTVSAGTLRAGVASVANVSGAFGNNSAVIMANVAGAILNLNSFNNQIGSLTGGGAAGGNVTLGAATLTVGGDNSSPAAYAGVISGTGGLTKIGAGTLTLSGVNTYTGATTVNAGTLIVSGSISGSTTALSGSGSTLGGSGSVGTVTIGSGNILEGGNGTSASGALSAGGNVSLASGALIELTLGPSATNSSITRTGGVWSFNSAQAFTFNMDLGASATTYDNLITGLTGSEAGLSNIANWTISNPGVSGAFSYDGKGDVDLTLSAIPEPGAAALLLAGLPLLGWRRRRQARGKREV